MDGPVIGVRFWSTRLTDDHLLRGTAFPALELSVWHPGTNEAQCATPIMHDKMDPDRPTPAEHCGCGWYAFHTWELALRSFYRQFLSGIVRGWGSMHLHPNGWRSQFAEVLALIDHPAPLYRQRIKVAAERYEVPVIPYGAMPEIASEFGHSVPQRYWPHPK